MTKGQKRSRAAAPPRIAPPDARGRGRNSETVLNLLTQADRPMSAYDLLAAMSSGRNVSPVSVYRALDQLIAAGKAHRLESLNAFVLCTHAHEASRANVFAICDSCGGTHEFPAPEFLSGLLAQPDLRQFQVTRVCFELHGQCQSCSSSRNPLGGQLPTSLESTQKTKLAGARET